MLKAWRRAALMALAGGAALAAQLVAIAPAQAAGPTVTIAATSRYKPVTNDVYVLYHAGTYSNAAIHGTISGAKAGEVAILFGQQYPFTKPAVRLGSRTLSAATSTYSFTVTPTFYTKYAVQLFASPTATQHLASSAVQNVYVTIGGPVSGPVPANCARPVCHETLQVYTIVPSSALGVEMVKHNYPYFGLNLNPTREPPPPSWLYLNAGHPSISAARRISASEYENTFTFSFTIGNDGYYWLWNGCTSDTLSKDGLGLPGYHNCGISRIPAGYVYLG